MFKDVKIADNQLKSSFFLNILLVRSVVKYRFYTLIYGSSFNE